MIIKMDQSYSENDLSMSPSQILERLHMLRQLQLMQRGKLQKQRLQYQDTSENSSCITEMISHFTNSMSSTSYNTFKSLLQSPQKTCNESSQKLNTSDISKKVQDKDLIEGISVLNLSQESEFIVNTPTSGRSKISEPSKLLVKTSGLVDMSPNTDQNKLKNKHISFDEMPILSPKKDFETLVMEKLKSDKNSIKDKCPNSSDNIFNNKKPFLKRGEGMARFGLKKNALVIQNTNSLPWKKKSVGLKPINSPLKQCKPYKLNKEKLDIEIVIPPLKLKGISDSKKNDKELKNAGTSNTNSVSVAQKTSPVYDTSNCSLHSENKILEKIIKLPKGKYPLRAHIGKTWASVLTKEQNDFLTQLKQSDYYKNFASPAKSTISNASCDENTIKLRQEKESAEQNLFDLLENKVSNESFNLENSFFNRFLRRNNLECSGESTPFVLQKCLANNPNLMHIFSDLTPQQQNDSCNDTETYQSECTECCSDVCSSVSSCCSCKTVEPATPDTCKQDKKDTKIRKEVQIDINQNNKCHDEVDKEQEVMKANMVEMNEKLITTSELLKERLRELEDEIETFRKENMNLNKLKEEVDMERQKFYDEKKTFEQKFNEEKILSEYYLAEEKEKLNKQKQMYERYVREMRGRLNKKEKDEVVSLKQEINNLKEEIRIKDAKSTSTIARLRNQIKIMDKEKTELQNEVEKLKKENRRIQHSNDITRRLTNMKYLEQINKKLSNMNKGAQSEVELSSDVKYKAFEIERQSRSRKAQPMDKPGALRQRAKSVPNLKVTSRYAKYFSQRDAISQIDRNTPFNVERYDIAVSDSDDENLKCSSEHLDAEEVDSVNDKISSYSDNNLERMYMETFKSTSPKSIRSSKSYSNNYMSENNSANSNNGFFLRKSNSSSSTRDSKSPIRSVSPHSNGQLNRSKSPLSIINHRISQRSPINSHNSENLSSDSYNSSRSKSPVSISNHSSQKSATVIHKDHYRDKLMSISPEPSSSKTSLVKTNLNPTEIKKPDGSRELRFPNGNVKFISADGKYCKFVYYNGDVKENFYNEGRIKYFYVESKTFHTTHADGLEVLEFPDGQVEKRYKDGSSEIRLPNGSVRYHDPKNEHIREEWRFPDGSALTVSANGERRVVFANGQIEVHTNDHKRREFPDGTVKLVYNDGTSETRYASGRVRIKDKHGNLIMDSAPG